MSSTRPPSEADLLIAKYLAVAAEARNKRYEAQGISALLEKDKPYVALRVWLQRIERERDAVLPRRINASWRIWFRLRMATIGVYYISNDKPLKKILNLLKSQE